MGVRGVGIIEIITELQDLKRYNQNEKKNVHSLFPSFYLIPILVSE